jgi:hypothetical protein
MNRRLFFRSLIGGAASGAAAAEVPAAKPEPERILARAPIPRCVCGFEFMVVSAWTPDDWHDGARGGMFESGILADNPTPGQQYMTCQNLRCSLHGKAFLLPTVEIVPAPPSLKRTVDKAIEAERTVCAGCRRLHHPLEACFAPGSVVRIPVHLENFLMWEAKQ